MRLGGRPDHAFYAWKKMSKNIHNSKNAVMLPP